MRINKRKGITRPLEPWQSPTLGKVAETKVAQVAESIGLATPTLYKQQYMLRLDAVLVQGRHFVLVNECTRHSSTISDSNNNNDE